MQRATDAKTRTDEAQIKEKIQLAYHSALAGGQGSYTKNSLMDELEKEFKTDYDVDDSDNEVWKMRAHGQEVEIPAGKTGNTQIEKLKTYFVGKNRMFDVWHLEDYNNFFIEPTKVEGKDVFVVGISEEKDWILYDGEIYEILFEDATTAYTNVTDVILPNANIKPYELGLHEGVITTADGTHPVNWDWSSIDDNIARVTYRDIDFDQDGWELWFNSDGIACYFYPYSADT